MALFHRRKAAFFIEKGFLRQGVSQAKWKECFPELKEKTDRIAGRDKERGPDLALNFLILLSKEMAKQTAGEKELAEQLNSNKEAPGDL